MLRIVGDSTLSTVQTFTQNLYLERLRELKVSEKNEESFLMASLLDTQQLKENKSAPETPFIPNYDVSNPCSTETIRLTKKFEEEIKQYQAEINKRSGFGKKQKKATGKKQKKKKKSKTKTTVSKATKSTRSSSKKKKKNKASRKTSSKNKNKNEEVDIVIFHSVVICFELSIILFQLQLLPVWIIKKIFCYLDLKTLKKIKTVNSYWAYVIEDLFKEFTCRKYIDKQIKKAEVLFLLFTSRCSLLLVVLW